MTRLTPSTLRIGYRYRPNRLAPEYDALVIGSGMGGLTTAALLSELGWKVCVLEQHYTAGGYTHSYERGGYEWDVGVHYIGDVGAPNPHAADVRFPVGRAARVGADGRGVRSFLHRRQGVLRHARASRPFATTWWRSFRPKKRPSTEYMALLGQVGGALSMLGMERVLRPWQRSAFGAVP